MGKGGGSAPTQPTTQTVQQTNLPPWAQPYSEAVMGKAQALTDINSNPYQPYGGQRLADFSPMQQQGFWNTATMQPSAATGYGMDIAADAANQARGMTGYQPMQQQNFYDAPWMGSQDVGYTSTQAPQLQQYQIDQAPQSQAAQTDYNPQLQQYQMGPAERVYGAQTGYNPQLQQYQMGPAERVQGAQANYDPRLQQYQMGPAERVQGAQANFDPRLQQYQMGPAERVRGEQVDYNQQLQQYQMGPAQQVSTGTFTQPDTAAAYMSPYMQNVVNTQQREAQRQADVARTGRQAQAVGAGAFGGSRQAIMDAEADRNLATQKGDIQAQGLQAAYQQAQQAYQTDSARQLQAQQSNQQAGLQTGQQNLAAALGVQQLGAQQGLQAGLANQQARQQAALANQQAGLQTGQQNLAAALGVQQLGTQTGLQTALANQQAQQQAALANQQAGLQTGQQNLAAALGVQQLGTQTGLQTTLANQQAQQQAALANQQAGLQTGQQNLAAALGVQQLGTQTGLQTSLANQQTQQQAALANQQAGLQTGQQNLAAALGVQQLGTQTGLQTSLANQQARQQTGLANQQAALSTGQQNLAAALGVQQLGAQQGLQSQQLNQAAQLQAQQQGLSQQQALNQNALQSAQLRAQYGLGGAQAAEQSRQYGAGLGLQGIQQQLSAAGQLGQLGGQQYSQQMGINQAMLQGGAQQQALQQQQLTNQYQDYLNQINYPYQQLGFMSDVLRGVPTGAGVTTAQQYQASPGFFSQIAGLGQLGIGLGAINRSFGGGQKAGGVVKTYKKGGTVGYSEGGIAGLAGQDVNLTDPSTELGVKSQLTAAKQGRPTMVPLSTLLALQAQIQQLHTQPMAAPQSPQQTTVADELIAQASGQQPPQGTEAPQQVIQQAMQASPPGQPPGGAPGQAPGGLPALSAPNINPQSFNAAGGGIVAFTEGGDTIPDDDVGIRRARELAERRMSQAERDVLRGRTPAAAPAAGSIEPDAALRRAASSGLGSTPEAAATAAQAAPEVAPAAAQAEEAAESAGKRLIRRVGDAAKRVGPRAGVGGAAVAGVAADLYGDALTRSGVEDLIPGEESQRAGQVAAAPTSATPGGTSFDVIARGETGEPVWNSPKALASINRQDTNNSHSYGPVGLNSVGGMNSPAGRFATNNPGLGLKGVPGTDEFANSWTAAAAEKPKEMATALRLFTQENYITPVTRELSKLDIPASVVNDPRVVTYFGDRSVQYGGLRTPKDIKKAWEASKGSIPAFLTAVNQADTDNLQVLFPTALKQNRYSPKAHAARLHTRLTGALGIGSGDVQPQTPKESFLDSAADLSRRTVEVAGNAVQETINPGTLAGKQAVATTSVDPKTKKVISEPPSTATKQSVASPKEQTANNILVAAQAAKDAGDPEKARMLFNLGMSLVAGGAATLGARGAEAQGFGPLAKGITTAAATYLPLAKDDEARAIRRQQLTETQRKDLAQEARSLIQLNQSGVAARAKGMLPNLEMMSEEDKDAKLSAATTVLQARYALENLSPEHRAALYGRNADSLLAKAIRENEAILKSRAKPPAGKDAKPSDGFKNFSVVTP